MSQPHIKLAAKSVAGRWFGHGGWFLLVAGGIFGITSWRWKKRRRLPTAAPRSIDVGKQPTRPPAIDGVNLELLWFMCDGRSESLPAEIERYLAAFQNDLRSTRAAVASRAPREIHRSAHRLVAHSAAVNYEPLLQLATQLQSEASTLEADHLDQLMHELDLRFAELRKTLGAIPHATECA